MATRIPVGRISPETGRPSHGWALVDDDIAERNSALGWHAQGRGYVGATIAGSIDVPSRRVYLHRLVVGEMAPGHEVDHIDGDRRNNTRANLQVGTRAQNQQNRRGAHPRSTTGVRGVVFDRSKPGKPLRAKLKLAARHVWLGSYAKLEEAAAAGRARLFAFSAEGRAMAAQSCEGRPQADERAA